MFVNNFYTLLSAEITGLGKNAKGYDGGGFYAYKYGTPSWLNIATAMKTVLTTKTGGLGVIFGTGNAAPSANDYTISGEVIDKLTVSASVTNDDDGTASWVKCVYTLTNNTGNTITVGEVALYTPMYYSASGGRTYGMYERTALNTPLVLVPGDVGQVEYTVEFTRPAA